MLEEARTHRQRVEDDIRNLLEVNRETNLQSVLQKYQSQLHLSEAQHCVYKVLCADLDQIIQPVPSSLLQDF
jgi:hypothetical protein